MDFMDGRTNAPSPLTRRRLLGFGGTAALLALGGCASNSVPRLRAYAAEAPFSEDDSIGIAPDSYAAMYGPVFDGGFDIPAVPVQKMDKRFLRTVVPDPTGERPGTIVVDTSAHYLYLVRDDGQAIRYGVGLGRQGFEWQGRAVVQWKQTWPKWTPPAEMIARDPKLEQYSAENGGMPPGLMNPLGARALYIFQNGEDTLYRLHGSPEWFSIGKSTSSGCVRLINQDIIDLYDRVPERTPIVVTPGLGVA